MNHIVVIGEMGVGKTTIGRLLARALCRPFFDSDEMIEADTGMTGADISARKGTAALHDLELEVFAAMTGSSMPAVLAPASSVVDRKEGRSLLRTCTTIWLVAPDDVLEKRQSRGDHRRAMSIDERNELAERRHPHLEEIAAIRIDIDEKSPQEVLRRVTKALSDLS